MIIVPQNVNIKISQMIGNVFSNFELKMEACSKMLQLLNTIDFYKHI
jgi:hypothetical protein